LYRYVEVGAALVARCAYDAQPEVVEALERLPFYPAAGRRRNSAWARLGFDTGIARWGPPDADAKADAKPASAPKGSSLSAGDAPEGFTAQGLPFSTSGVPDIEDIDAIHTRACANGEKFYNDPKTGYLVMTKVNHQARGKCCGSGCRHCPFAHVNVRDKAMRIQNPAVLHKPAAGVASQVIVLMWSGGKDSFLALRAMLKPGGVLHAAGPAGVVLLTTFDADTRMVAHQAGAILTYLL
jgi:hypothetical protein